MNFLANNPLIDDERQRQQANYIRGGQAVQQGPTLTDTVVDMVAPKVMESVMTSGANALATGSATAGLGASLGGTAIPTAAGGMGAAMGAMGGPIGMAAMLALPYLFKDGTTGVPEMDYGPDPLQGYMNGTNYVGYNQGTNMAYAGGTDSVPAMLTPGEAVIPAAAAQNPNNKPAINAMVAEGRQANAVANNSTEEMPQEPMMGPLSGKSQREERKSQMEEMKNLQEMSFNKKAFNAEQARKQEIHELKLTQMYEKHKSSITT
jgi:hypothetical protein